MQNLLLEIKNLNLSIDNKKIISNLNLEINKGDFTVLLGSNGSGKSSLLKLISRIYQPTSGVIKLFAKDVSAYAKQQYLRRVLTISQTTADNLFLSMTVYENARLYLGDIKKAELQQYLRDYNPNLCAALDLPASVLSGGEQQVLVLALCLRLQPDLLLLDEHTSGLDPKIAAQIMQLTHDFVRRHNVSCIMTTHNLEHARSFADRIIAINAGTLVHESSLTSTAQINSSELLALCYNSPANPGLSRSV